MKNTTLFDILKVGLFNKWRHEVETEMKLDLYYKNEQNALQELQKGLDENRLDLLKSYALLLEDRIREEDLRIDIKILNLGIKIGMEAQAEFAETEDF